MSLSTLIVYAHQLADMTLVGDAPEHAQRTAREILNMLTGPGALMADNGKTLDVALVSRNVGDIVVYALEEGVTRANFTDSEDMVADRDRLGEEMARELASLRLARALVSVLGYRDQLNMLEQMLQDPTTPMRPVRVPVRTAISVEPLHMLSRQKMMNALVMAQMNKPNDIITGTARWAGYIAAKMYDEQREAISPGANDALLRR